ncbi:MAG TPA: hypothetical protein VEC36_05165, partial [Patescibacteria group bacterium]|nr:hypothetical protein [Patescibacteria group bacterium]
MNLELLISKYLDGDLTPEDDQLLRKILSEEPLAREEFEGAALLHVEMQQDAESIVPPADILSATEDMIMMRIMNHSIQDSGRPTQFLKMSLKRRVASLFSVAVMLFTFTIPFQDGNVGVVGNTALMQGSSSGKPEAMVGIIQNVVDSQNNVVPLRLTSMRPLHQNFLRSNTLSNPGETASLAVLSETADVENEIAALHESAVVINPIAAMSEAIKNSSGAKQFGVYSDYQSDRSADIALQAEGRTSGNSEKGDEVQVSTFLATNVLKSSRASEAAIASVSQSISYGINSNDRIGLELGYTSYTYEGNATVLVPSTSMISMNTPEFLSKKSDGILVKPSMPKDESKSTTKPAWKEEEVAYTDQGRMYWGAAFYERRIVQQGNASVHGRLGIGGSGEGGVAYGRVFGKYDFLE